ncbi:unnamed protein product [Toxocara canis]|uniref:DUF4113 domain-containing protein n=1 Tax=Toxocara canis TaxID=6265 RepID=A0A183VEE0_TOXCA|nr:unnamed protein product [Toxocara canis]
MELKKTDRTISYDMAPCERRSASMDSVKQRDSPIAHAEHPDRRDAPKAARRCGLYCARNVQTTRARSSSLLIV